MEASELLLGIGYLYEKKKVEFENKVYEYYEMIDYVAGIDFCTIFNTNVIHILTGNYSSQNAGVFHKNGEERKYMVFDKTKEFSTNDIRNNGWEIDFYKIREEKLKPYNTIKYFFWNNKKGELRVINNIELLKYLIDSNDKSNERKLKI